MSAAGERLDQSITKLANAMYDFVDTNPDIIPGAHWYGRHLREAMVVALEAVLASRLSADAAARALIAELKEKP